MTFRYALGPVFYFEWLIASRRWQQFVGRSLFVLLLFLSLFIVWLAEGATGLGPAYSRSYLADMGEKFFYAVIGTQLTLVLLVAPAVTAGAVCVDKARGTLLYLLATDLSNVEIVLGKLVQRLLTLFSLVLCALPVLFLGALEGGIDLEALLGSFLVTIGIALFTGTLALTFSVWCKKTYEVLLATYLLIFLTMIFNPAVHVLGVKRTLPFWVEALNPYWMVFGPYWSPGAITIEDDLYYLGVCAALAALLAALAIWRVRAVAIHQSNQLVKPRRCWLDLGAWTRRLPGLAVDINPVLWREWHSKRPSRWVRFVWLLYALGAVLFSSIAIFQYSRNAPWYDLGPFVNAFQVAIGLLLAGIASLTALSEERLSGTIDLLLTTTIPTWKIVVGKWLGVYRTVVLLGVLPCAVGCAAALRGFLWPGVVVANIDSWIILPVFACLFLSWGAAITSFGLALSTWLRRSGRALALLVIVYVFANTSPLIVALLLRNWGGPMEGIAIASPWFGSGGLTAFMGEGLVPERMKFLGWSVAWVSVYALAAAVLFILVLLTFNACLGRMPYYGLPIDAVPRSDLDGMMRGNGAARRWPGKGRHPADWPSRRS